MKSNGLTSERKWKKSQRAAVMAQAQRHQEGVALFLLIPYRPWSSSALAAEPTMKSRVKRVRDQTVLVSGATRMLASSKPATVMAAWDPSVAPMPTYWASQKSLNAPCLSAA